ncbi:MAG: OmpH family outer membrane protein [Parvularculaceae bacterium]
MFSTFFSKRTIVGAIFTAMVASFAFTSTASAKEPVILIIDQSRLIATSKAGKSINTQLAAMQKTANKELEAKVSSMTTEANALKKNKASLSAEDYVTKARALSVKQSGLQQLREIRVRELSIAESRAMGKISNSLKPILKSMVEKRGATILLDRSAVMYADPKADITAAVLKQLDAKLTTVKVLKVDLQAEAKKMQAAQAAKK